MSPYLFALFLNDLENFMENQNSTDLNTYREHWYCFRCIYIFFTLLYADDTVLMSESLEELQENWIEFTNIVQHES